MFVGPASGEEKKRVLSLKKLTILTGPQVKCIYQVSNKTETLTLCMEPEQANHSAH